MMIGLALGLCSTTGMGGGLAQAYLSRMTGAEFGFADLTRLFTTNTGTTNVAAGGDAIGLIVGREKQDGKTLSQTMTTQAELRGNGTTGLTGSATPATYNTGTGAGTVSRVDGSNQSYVVLPLGGTGKLVRLDIEVTGSPGVNVRQGTAGASLVQPINGRFVYYLDSGSNNALSLYLNGASGTSTFTVHSCKLVPTSFASQATAGSRGSYQAGGILRVATDDAYSTSALPGKMLMARCKPTGGAAVQIVAGSVGASGTDRSYIGIDASNRAICRIGNDAQAVTGVASLAGVDCTIGARWNGSLVELAVNGVVVGSRAQVGAPSTTAALAIGGYNNNGTLTSFFTGDIITGSRGDAVISGDLVPTDAELLALHNHLMAA